MFIALNGENFVEIANQTEIGKICFGIKQKNAQKTSKLDNCLFLQWNNLEKLEKENAICLSFAIIKKVIES